MNEITFSVLLEFLYNKFAVTFVLCFVGAFMHEILSTTKKSKDKSKMFNIKRAVTSTVFSTFLMCACAVYVDLQFETYAVLSVICGLWGFALIKLVMNKNFVTTFISKMIKKITSPIIKSAAETITEMSEEKKKSSKSKKNNESKDDNKDSDADE